MEPVYAVIAYNENGEPSYHGPYRSLDKAEEQRDRVDAAGERIYDSDVRAEVVVLEPGPIRTREIAEPFAASARRTGLDRLQRYANGER